MKKLVLILIVIVSAWNAAAQDRTLRLDYIFSGTDQETDISLRQLSYFDGWAGRRTNLDQVPLKGNGQIAMTDLASGKVLYRTSFSTLFQEWQAQPEAAQIRKAFENTFLLPMPSVPAKVQLTLYDSMGEDFASIEHTVDPSDILIKNINQPLPEYKYLLKNGDPSQKIDVAIVAEGYTEAEMESFYEHAQIAMEAILEHEPFGEYKDRFNFVAVALESKDSGVTVPRQALWKETAVGSNYDTFYVERYLTTSNVWKMHDALAGLPYEHLVILANTDTYGGGGIYNSYTLTTALHPAFRPVVVHEFGHSFAGLGDEYYNNEDQMAIYYSDYEPWEQNITTLYRFDSKWEDMLPRTVQIPTPSVDGIWEKIAEGAEPEQFIGVYEGGGYQAKGVYRPYPDCRMKTNGAPAFCPVCQRAIARIIEFYTE